MWDGTEGTVEAPNCGRLLIDALRRIAAGCDGRALTEREFATAFPGDGCEVLATFRVFLQAVARASRRRLRTGHPGAVELTADETLLLAVVAAAQQADDARLDAHLRWLARAEAGGAVALTARALAAALASHGHWLPTPAPVRIIGQARRALVIPAPEPGEGARNR